MTIQKTLLFIGLISICLLGCKKSTSSVVPDDGKGTMSASIDGTDWSAVKITLSIWTSSQLHIKGEASDGSLIQISIMGIDGPGTYPVGAVSSTNIAMYRKNDDEAWSSGFLTPEGTINVESLSTGGTKGTFSFIGTDAETEKTISNGKFDINF